MEYILYWVIGILLAIISIIDWKFRQIPSILLTSFLIIGVVFNPFNLFVGLIGFLFALLLHEFDYFRGYADMKVFTALSFFAKNFTMFVVFLIVFLIIGITYKYVIKKIYPNEEEFAFIPVFLITYVVLLIIGGVF